MALQDGATIILVEDEQESLESLSSSFEKNGYTVFTAKSGNEAITLFQNLGGITEPDSVACVVSDWKMDDGDGLQLLDWIRSQPQFSQIPFVLISGMVTREELLTAVQHGVDAVQMKPFPLEQIRAKVEEAIRNRQHKLQKKAA